MKFNKQTDPLDRCKGCGRLVRRSAMVSHNIIAAVEHAQKAVERQSFDEAYAIVVAECAARGD